MYRTIIFLVLLLMLQGCAESTNKLDGEMVKTQDGRYFTVVHNIGDTYFLRPVDVVAIKKNADFIDQSKP